MYVIVVPSMNYKYLQKLYSEVYQTFRKNDDKIFFLSPFKKYNSFFNLLLYPFKIIFLLTRYSHKITILHLHWIEILVRWGKNTKFIPFLVPLVLGFLKFVKRFSKIKIVVTLHNTVPHNPSKSFIEYVFFRIVLSEISDCVFVHTHFSKNFSMAYYGITEKKLVILEHGLLGPVKNWNNSLRIKKRKELNFSKNDVVFCFVGSIQKYKGVHTLLSAIREELKKLGKAIFIIAGKPDEKYVNKLVINYKDVLANDRVIFKPEYLSEIEFETFLGVSDFGVCPYNKATTPATLLNFMRYKLPIITSNDPNVFEILKGYPFISSKRGDFKSLSNALNFAYHNRLVYNEKAKAFNLNDLRHSWVRSAEKTYEKYIELAEK